MPISLPAQRNGTKKLWLSARKRISIPGLFKERQDGAGHSYGNTAVREYINMTDEDILYIPQDDKSPEASDTAYIDFGYEKRTPEQIDAFGITPAYRSFAKNLYLERDSRPAALRDIMDFPADISSAVTTADFDRILDKQNLRGNINYLIRGLNVTKTDSDAFSISFSENSSTQRLEQLAEHFKKRFSDTGFSIAVTGNLIDLKLASTDSLLAIICLL